MFANHLNNRNSEEMRSRLKTFGFLDIATAVVLVSALAVAVRPGSSLYMSTSEWWTARRNDRAVAERWDKMSGLAQKLYVGSERPDIIEISDYECPFCRELSVVVDSAVRSGVKVGLLHFPLPRHLASKPAARAAICADKVGKFPELHHFLMSSDTWQSLKEATPFGVFKPVAEQREAQACYGATEVDNILADHISMAEGIGVAGTPTFVTRHGKFTKKPSLENLRAVATAK